MRQALPLRDSGAIKPVTRQEILACRDEGHKYCRHPVRFRAVEGRQAMTLTIEIFEAKARLSEPVAREAGEEIGIARGREPVARIVRLPPARRVLGRDRRGQGSAGGAGQDAPGGAPGLARQRPPLTLVFVIDASLAATWFLLDEGDPATAALGEEAPRDPQGVPPLLLHEMRSLLINAARRGRASRDATWSRGSIAETRGRATAAKSPVWRSKHGLSTYDATYLALDEGLRLATLDKELAAAARAENVPILGPLAP